MTYPLLQILKNAAHSNPNGVFATWYNNEKDNRTIETKHMFANLWEEADAVAYRLRNTWKLNEGDRVVLTFNPGMEFFTSFLGCIRAGIVAVLVDPPSKPLEKSLPEMTKIVNECKAKLIIVDSKVQMLRMADRSDINSKSRHLWPWTQIDTHANVKRKRRKSSTPETSTKINDNTSIENSDFAFLQYRSGSADTPKSASKVTYGDLDVNGRSIILAMLQTYNIDVSFGPESKDTQHGIVDLSWLTQEDSLLPNDKQESKENELIITNLKSSKIDINLKPVLSQNSMNVLFDPACAADSEETKTVFDLDDISDAEIVVDSPADTLLVGLVAHNGLKPSMMEFVKDNLDFFKRVKLVTTQSTGLALSGLGLMVDTLVSSGPLGGDQEIGAMIAKREVAAMFFFVDPLSSHPHQADIAALNRLCCVHDIMFANNPSSAKGLIFSLEYSVFGFSRLMGNDPNQKKDSKIVENYKTTQKKVIANVQRVSGA